MKRQINSRVKGNGAELKIIKSLKELGFLNVISSRAGSRILDNKGVDFTNLPFALQSKKGYDTKGKWYQNVLEYMKSKCSDIDFDFFAIVHSYSGKQGVKRKETDDLVIMTNSDFEKLLKLAYGSGK
jgi:hypothetical protein